MEGPGFELRQPGPRACATVHALGSEVSAKDLISKASDGEGERVLLAFKVLVIECHIQNCIYHKYVILWFANRKIFWQRQEGKKEGKKKDEEGKKEGEGEGGKEKEFQQNYRLAIGV